MPGNTKGMQYWGNAVLAKVHGSIGNYEVALEVAGDGNVYLNTAYKVNKKAEADSKRLSPASGEGVSDGNPASASASIQSIRERFAPVNSSGFFFFKASALSSFIENSLPQILPQSG